MHEELADKLQAHPNRAKIEADTGVTQQTMRNIISDPKAKRQRLVINALESYFRKNKGKI